jgi:hypothetical protein
MTLICSIINRGLKAYSLYNKGEYQIINRTMLDAYNGVGTCPPGLKLALVCKESKKIYSIFSILTKALFTRR